MKYTVATVLRTGGEYRIDHVHRLAAQVAATSPGARFVCLSDLDVPNVETIPLVHGWPGWWSKIELFSPGLLRGPTVYLDLDTDVIGDLAALVPSPRSFRMLSDFYSPQRPASGVMAWGTVAPASVYRRFETMPETHMARCRIATRWGDQGFIAESLDVVKAPPSRIHEGLVVSYKAHCLPHKRARDGAALPDEAVAVAYHGRPRPWDTPIEWRSTIASAVRAAAIEARTTAEAI